MALGFILAWLGISTALDKIESEKNRKEAKNKNELFYYDKYGNLRDRKTNDYCSFENNENGDRCVVTFSGRVVDNLTYKNDLIKRKQDYNIAINDPERTVYFYRSNRNKAYNQPSGDRYADKNTGEIYVRRKIKFNFIDEELGLIFYTADVYMNLSGELIRQTDESIKLSKKNKGIKGRIQNDEELTLKCIEHYNANRKKEMDDGRWIEDYLNYYAVH